MNTQLNLKGLCGIDGAFLCHVREKLLSDSRNFDAEVIYGGHIVGKVRNDGCGAQHEFLPYDAEAGDKFVALCRRVFGPSATPFYGSISLMTDCLLDLSAWAGYIKMVSNNRVTGCSFREMRQERSDGHSPSYQFHTVPFPHSEVAAYCVANDIARWDSPRVVGYEKFTIPDCPPIAPSMQLEFDFAGLNA